MAKGVWFLGALTIALLSNRTSMLAAAERAPLEPFTVARLSNVSVTATADGVPSASTSAAEKAERSVTGTEDLHGCHGRKSSAMSSGEVRTVDSEPLDQRSLIVLSASAAGGHYLEGECFWNKGHDTTASARARGWIEYTLSFPASVRPVQYVANWMVSSDGNPGLAIATEARLNDEPPVVNANEPVAFISKGGGRYTFRISAALDASNTGACCSDTRSGTASATLRIRRVPLLASALRRGRLLDDKGTFTSYLIGGAPTSAYLAVGALLLNGELQCTGTLVGPATVLTAAHCVAHAFEKDVADGHMSFRLGQYATDDSKVPFKVVGKPRYPETYRESSDAYVDDIGLVDLETAPPVTPYRISIGTPPLLKDRALDFVGFGYTKIGSDPAAAGVKRHASMKIRTLADKTFLYGNRNAHTCSGDSGGPAFLATDTHLLVAGVTSGGDPGCALGAVDTRVDAYTAWLTAQGAVQ